MAADQAAGLRRRRAGPPPRCSHCFFDAADFTLELAQALQRRGQTVLLVDACGRMFAGASTRSLFDWKQQLDRGALHTLALACGDGWYAPGVQADEAALRGVVEGYDHVLFDTLPDQLALMQGATHAVALEVSDAQRSMRRAYALLKTLSRLGEGLRVGLLGDPVACARVQAACSHFLDPLFNRGLYSVAHEDDAFAALAVRMAAEEASLETRYKTGKT